MVVWHSAAPLYFFEDYQLFPDTMFIAIREIFTFAAEGFVCMSGLTLGAIMVMKQQKKGYFSQIWRSFRQALRLLIMQYLLAMFVAWFLHSSGMQPIADAGETLLEILTLRRQDHLVNILPMFVVFKLLSPFITPLLKSIWGQLILLAVSLGFLALSQFDPYFYSLTEAPAFPLVSWQFFFVFGAVLGAHFQSFKKISKYWLLLIAVLVGILFFPQHAWQLSQVGGVVDVVSLPFSFAKFPLAALRVLYVALILGFLVLATARCSDRFFESAPIRFLRIWGQYSFPLFALHVMVTYVGQYLILSKNILFPTTVLLFAIQAFVFSYLGLFWDRTMKPYGKRLVKYPVVDEILFK